MRILVSNDDGYQARGIRSLVEALRQFGELTIVAPKSAQSGMSMAVSMGFKPIAVKHLYDLPGEDWWYLDGTPASCIKFGIDNIFWPAKPDLVVTGINHGNNAATATLYSGTIGAAMEGALYGIPAIGVSLDTFDEDADFSAVEARPSFKGRVRTLGEGVSALQFGISRFTRSPAVFCRQGICRHQASRRRTVRHGR